MKRILLTLSFAALALSGCIQDELLDNGGGSETAAVEFGTYLGRSAQTRATVITSETLKGEGFGVNAWYTGLKNFDADALADYDVFMNNTRVAHDGTAWAYSPLKYWPNNPNEMVSFVAYAPYNMVTAADGTVSEHPNIKVSGTDVTYTVANEVKDQVDLLWSDSNESDDYKTIDLKKQTVDDKVTFYFKHALSKVSFKVGALIDMVEDDTTDGELGSEVLAPETVIKVRKVVLMGGSDTYSETEGWLTTGGPFYIGGTLSLMDGTWSSQTAGQRFEFTAEEHFIVDENKEFVLDQNNSNELNELLTDDSYLMIIPQDLTTGGFKIYIEYDVITTDSAATDGSVVVKNRITSADAITSIDFEQGKQYNINMILGMTTVKFDVEVSEWIPADDENSDNPANKNEEGGATVVENSPEDLLARDNTESGYDVGDGSEKNPYKIDSPQDLVFLSQQVNANNVLWNNSSIHYIQTKDIDMSGIENFVPIGFEELFYASYDASYIEEDGFVNYYLITGLKITNNTVGGNVGLFGKTMGDIRGVQLDAEIISDADGSRIGGIVGYNYGSDIENCSFIGSINVTGSNTYVGGIVGAMLEGSATVFLCISSADLSGSDSVGGIIGELTNGHIVACINHGKVEGSENVGGIAGYAGWANGDVALVACVNNGDVKGKDKVGGIAGLAFQSGLQVEKVTEGVILSCANTGNITTTGASAQGGSIIGAANDAGQWPLVAANYSIATAYSKLASYGEGFTGEQYGESALQSVDSWTEEIIAAMNAALKSSDEYAKYENIITFSDAPVIDKGFTLQ